MGVLAGEELGFDSHKILLFQGNSSARELRIGNCYRMSPKQINEIVYWNDDKKLSFGEIADQIETWIEVEAE